MCIYPLTSIFNNFELGHYNILTIHFHEQEFKMSAHEHPSNPDLDGIKLAQVWNITYHFYLFCLRQDKSVCLYVYKMIEDSKSGSRKNRVFSQSGKRLERMIFMISYTNNLSRIVGHVYQKRCSKFVILFTINARVSHSGEHGGHTLPPPSYSFFQKPLPPKLMSPTWSMPPT